MPSFTSLFPDPMECYFSLFQDFVYVHDEQYIYSFDHNDFVRRDRVKAIRIIRSMADRVYAALAVNEPGVEICTPTIDYSALISVLARYSRDVYGFRRISAKIRHLGNRLEQDQREELERIIVDGADFGFKMPTGQPYIERQTAVLLYWFSVLKPFHLGYKHTRGKKPPEVYMQAYFNEYFSYFMTCLALYPLSITIDIHKNTAVFEEFLNQLHFRNLSRSSLEFFLPYYKRKA
jgi:hypothetical protein